MDTDQEMLPKQVSSPDGQGNVNMNTEVCVPVGGGFDITIARYTTDLQS